MLDNLKQNLKRNKGYYTLLLTDTVAGSVIMGVQFALINPPLAAAVAVLNFGANIAAGLAMTPKQGQEPEPPLAESAAAVSNEPEQSFYKKFRTYQRSTFYDPKYVVESTASGAGATLLFSTLLGMKSVIATHSILFLTAVAPPVGIAVGATLAAIGLYGVIVGNHAKWKGISKYYTAAFHKDSAGSAPKNARKTFIEKFSERPRMQKLLNSKWSKVTRSIMLRGMTLESAVFTLIAAPAVIVTHIAAMTSGPHAILTGIVPLAIAVNWARGPVWHAICTGWLFTREALQLKSKLKAKKAAKKNPAAETAEPAPDHTLNHTPDPDTAPAPSPAAGPDVEPVAAPLDPLAEPLADMFEKVAGNDNAKDVLATAAVSETPEKTRKTRKRATGPGSAPPDA